MKTIHEQREERRQAKLKHIQRQVKAGKLVVRQLTAEEQENDLALPRRSEASESAEIS
jgi:hypothetical protein